MNSFREVLFGKVDLDSMATALVLGISPEDQNLRSVSGSASAEELKDSDVLCLEVGGTGRTTENCFDHHPCGGERKIDLSAAAQALERMARLIHYVDEVDRGIRHDCECRFPSLVSLVSGMKLIVKEPEEQMRKGLQLMRTVLQSGLDPYDCMEKITIWMPEASEWIEAKRQHERHFAEATQNAMWFQTITGIKVVAVETTWIGAPGALYGLGAHVVIVLNPTFEQGGKVYRKYTIAVHRDLGINLSSAISELRLLEDGWGGPAHATICGSPQGVDSQLSMQTVADVVTKSLQGVKLVNKKERKEEEELLRKAA
ncbi:MAG: hypothetical protein WC848_02595 [Parcubacteria group bacterium]|jgi:hypothetical protein